MLLKDFVSGIEIGKIVRNKSTGFYYRISSVNKNPFVNNNSKVDLKDTHIRLRNTLDDRIHSSRLYNWFREGNAPIYKGGNIVPADMEICKSYLMFSFSTEAEANEFSRKYDIARKIVDKMSKDTVIKKVGTSDTYRVISIEKECSTLKVSVINSQMTTLTLDMLNDFFRLKDKGIDMIYDIEVPEAPKFVAVDDDMGTEVNDLYKESTIIGGLYRHFKGGLYVIQCLATPEDHRDGKLVIYKSVSTGEIWARDFEDFFECGEEIESRKDNTTGQYSRFKFIGKV